MIALFAPKRWMSHFVMGYLAFLGWMMTLSKRQDGYLNNQVNLFRLQYETHSLQMHPKLPCRLFVAPTTNISEERYVLRLVVFPCWYLTTLSPFFQPISPSTSSHIYSVAFLHILRRRMYPYLPPIRHRSCLPLSSPLTFSNIPIIPLLHHASVVILLHLYCGPHWIIFHRFAYFDAVVCLPSCIGSSHRSA